MEKDTLEQYLKALRSSCGYSQKFVASHLNITRQTYSHYETGRIIPPVNSLYNLSKLYGIPVENFLDLVVTYNIDMANVPSSQLVGIESSADLADYTAFINSSENTKKFKFLNHRERRLLFYYLLLEERDQDDILAFMKVKYHNRTKVAKK